MRIDLISPLEAFAQRGKTFILGICNLEKYQEGYGAASVPDPFGTLNSEEVHSLCRGDNSCFILCAAGSHAGKAATILFTVDHENLTVMEWGIQECIKVGLPVNKKLRMNS